jgi:type VI protein secretion system component VasA
MTTAVKKGSKRTSARRRGGSAISREKRAAYGELKQGVKHLEKSIGEIQKGLRRAERQIEADARARVRALRNDARTQLALVKEKQREAVRRLKTVSAAAEGSWQEVKQSADAILADAGATAASVVDRLRRALTDR